MPPFTCLSVPAGLDGAIASVLFILDVKGESDLVVAGECRHDEHGQGHVKEHARPLEHRAQPERVAQGAHTDKKDHNHERA